MKSWREALCHRFRPGMRRVCYKGDLKPHLIRYWLMLPQDPLRDETLKSVCRLYEHAPERAAQGERTMIPIMDETC